MKIQPIIDVVDVKRTYKTTTGLWKSATKEIEALSGISFNVQEGEIFGLLGPNGAGKTTMIKIMTTMLIPTSGKVSILGLNPVTEYAQLRPQINFILGGERNLYWRLTAYQNLAYFADLYQIPRQQQKKRIADLLDLVELTDAAHQKVETFSKGMKQRLQIARGLINEPKILFLDEPSIGLDPYSARKLRDILRQLKETGTTILLTTHYMYEADELCDRIAFIDKGKLVSIDSPNNLKASSNHLSIIECKLAGPDPLNLDALHKLSFIEHIQVERQDYFSLLRIHTLSPQAAVSSIFESLQGAEVLDLAITKPTLEDVYLQVIGGGKNA
ncbi:ATP-binding cassette domain-containing protein [Paenibacillus albiflavus]|uniref:ATP-binding cassette domain-containing protein n=1 Tax=Paenibacillus albiflavus TaxID=2545760 RepID=A0A4R4E3W7_9BACL|nr:ATP-binding cassette domain-containing protein [Paenibacillus albiflavus]TCZ72296.1 ATP-binding cassette domain-containing protein [Paenibacillus albiflavus]